MTLRITGGEYRSRLLKPPPDAAVSRPYPHRVREAVFNMLREWCEDARVLDLFAGVGTVGLETISRGAMTAVMVERDRRIFQLMKQNIAALGCEDRAVAVNADALGSAALLRAPAPVHLIFVDPPYPLMRDVAGRRRVLDQIVRCRPIMDVESFLVLRTPESPEDVAMELPGFKGPEPRRYGPDMWVLLYQPAGAIEQ